jgi:diguanylate cyclase (GGDEF)-like protein
MDELDGASAEQDRARAVTGAEVVIRAGALRARVAAYRARVAEHRARGAEDRAAAALEREQAQRDRLEALADREVLAHALAIAETDALTGARTRSAGLADLERELDRCRRTNGTLTVCYVDVVGLKAANDTDGHSAGDALLRDVVAGIRAHLRRYDVIIRFGGDEFVCAMPNVTLSDARERFSQVAAALAARPDARAIRTGFAQLGSGESASTLIERADADLIAGRA